jgi:archaemetzincin
MQRALVESELFQPIPKPRPGDWLDAHQETGQTFAQFARSRPNRPDQVRNTLYFVPLGDYDEAIGPDLKSLEKFARVFFGMPVKTLPVRSLDGLPIKVRQRSGAPKQLLSTDVLDWLKPILPEDAYCLLAITMEDLYPDEKWNYVFGQASLNDRVGVYSFIRYTPGFHGNISDDSHRKTILRRSCKVLAHETGHMFGIRHCVHFHCLMNGSNNLPEADRQPLHLCPVCLRKLQSAARFDVAKRYELLKQFSDDAQWGEEADWMAARLDQIR